MENLREAMTRVAAGKSLCKKCGVMKAVADFAGKTCKACAETKTASRLTLAGAIRADRPDEGDPYWADDNREQRQKERDEWWAEYEKKKFTHPESGIYKPGSPSYEAQGFPETSNPHSRVTGIPEFGSRRFHPMLKNAIDHDRVPADIRRHHIDQHIGRVNHIGHAYKGNDVVFAPNDTVYQQMQRGEAPNASSPYTVEYFIDRAFDGMRRNEYFCGDDAFKGTLGLEAARWMSDSQKERFAQQLRGHGLAVDEDTVKKCLKDGNEIAGLHNPGA